MSHLHSMHSGRLINYDSFSVDDVSLDDIAHHLSMWCRFGGGVDRFWSVASHCLYCHHLYCTDYDCKIARIELLILLHDAHEAYTLDWPAGLKGLASAVREVQGRIDTAIYKFFDIVAPTAEEAAFIRAYDTIALLGEAREFMPLRTYQRIRQNEFPNVVPPIETPTDWDNLIEVVKAEYKRRVLMLWEDQK